MIGRAVRLRIALTMGGFALALFGLGLRATELTLIQGDFLRSRARRQQTRMLALQPRRGPILDRAGEPLALTREAVDVYLRPRQFDAATEDIARLASLIDLPLEAVEKRAASPAPFVYLKRRVSPARWARVQALGLAGVGHEPTRERVYPRDALAGHVVGFTGIDGQGLEGIERQFDSDLRGEADALHVERDGRGRQWLLSGERGPLSLVGAQVELTIDAAIQHVAETALEDAVVEYGAKAGTAIVMDPRTGEILAMANAPRFDPNSFRRATPAHWRNRAITDVFEPGSTFKAFLAAAGLREHAVHPEEVIDCEGGAFRIGRRTIHDHHRYEELTFREVIANSSNIGCAKVGARVGSDKLAAVFSDFGFSRRTGISLPGEVGSLIRPPRAWQPIDLATASFGQGVAVSPLQLVNAFAALANRGELMRPYIVSRVTTADGRVLKQNTPEVVGRAVEPEIAAMVAEMLIDVVEVGTGKNARVPGFEVAGKTGTSQKIDPVSGGYHRTERIASFVGFVPARDPALAILVVVDTPTRISTYGGVIAAPVFKRIAERALRRVGVFPRGNPMLDYYEPEIPEGLRQIRFNPETDRGFSVLPVVEEGTPSFLGMGMRRALVLAQDRGLGVRVEGSGYVVAQEPAPGARGPGAVVSLVFAMDR